MKQIEKPFERISLRDLGGSIANNGQLMSYMDACGMFLCQEGKAEVNTNGHSFALERGDVYIYVPSTYVYVKSVSPDLKGITYKSNLGFVLPLVESSIIMQNIILLRDNPIVHLNTKQQKSVEVLIDLMEKRQDTIAALIDGDIGRSIMEKSLLSLGESLIREVIYYYFANRKGIRPPQDGKGKMYQEFMKELMQNYKKEREVSYYAEAQFLTPRYFSSVVKEHSGFTAQQWIIQIVINGIKQSLMYSDKSIKEISVEYHFHTQSFFGKYFKQYVGMSPKAFREQMRTNSNTLQR